jgi:hypothetical protein
VRLSRPVAPRDMIAPGLIIGAVMLRRKNSTIF